MRFTWVCLSLLAATLLAGGADAYDAHGRPWPGGVIRYYNAAPGQAWAVQAGAGRRVERERRPRPARRLLSAAQARTSASSTSPASTARSTPRRRSDTLRRARLSGSSSATTARRSATRMLGGGLSLAYEFGHVLGLEHETRGCSLMNPYGHAPGPHNLLEGLSSWQWRCKLLTRDDIAGAVALYGGAARGGSPGRATATCMAAIPRRRRP